ncbi:MAG TPA: sigma-70 family RNA polymerase sigma factor [Streptosporangiaceae bacterium]
MPAAARSAEEFARLAAAHRPELLALCYRMLGSAHEAEDVVQDTYLRAWRSYDGFAGRSSPRTWLYRIATNACLRALERAARRPLPSGLGAPGDDTGGEVAPRTPEVPWLEPFPDDPAAVVEARAGLRLALVAALQVLPPRRRAVLILRDVLEWPAAEVAGLLDTTTTAVNSLLQHARTQLRNADPRALEPSAPLDAHRRDLLDRYAAAFETADIAGLTRVLAEDAVWEMPPIPTWFAGRADVAGFLATRLRAPGANRMVPARANGQPAYAVYAGDARGGHLLHALHVVTVEERGIARVTAFMDTGALAAFGLPAALR